MEALEHFGVDYILIAAQIVNFLVILYLLKRFLYKPLFKVFQERQNLVKESITKAEEATKALEKAEKNEKAVIKKARDEANQLLTDAKDNAADIMKKAEEAARKQTQQLLAEAKEQIALETKKAQQELNKHMSELSVEILKKSLGNVFSDKEQSEVVAKAVKQLKK